MKHKKEESANSVWISRFWAQYNRLPEAFKEGFYSLTLSITNENEKEGLEQRVNNRVRTTSENKF